MPVLELAEREVRRRQLIPKNLTIKWIPYDDKCDASYATISAMDGYGDCGHVLFGPTCDYSLGNTIFFFRLAVPLNIFHSHASKRTNISCIVRRSEWHHKYVVGFPDARAIVAAQWRTHTRPYNFSFIDHKLINLCTVMESVDSGDADGPVCCLAPCATQQRQTTSTRSRASIAHTRIHTAINKELIRH